MRPFGRDDRDLFSRSSRTAHRDDGAIEMVIDVIVGGIVLAVIGAARIVWLLVMFLVRAPWTAVVVTTASGVLYLWGWGVFVPSLLSVALLLLIWSVEAPRTYRRGPGRWWARWWRRWLWYRWWWPFIANAIRAGLVEVIVFDPKGGMEFTPGADLFAGFHAGSVESMADALDALVLDMNTRATALAGDTRQHEPAPGSPHRVIVIDELATLTALADAKTTRRIEHALGLLLSKARATGITVVAAVIDPAKDVVRWRNLFPTRIALRLDERTQPDMVDGDGARDRGALCDAIPLATPGVGYVRHDTSPDVTRVRASWLDTPHIRALATTHARRAPEVQPAGEDSTNEERADTDGVPTWPESGEAA